MNIKGFELVGEEKLGIVLRGDGAGFAGVKDEDAILAEYDKRAGLILKDGVKVETGAFYDFDKKEYRKEPLIKIAEVKPKQSVIVETVGDDEEPKKAKVSKRKSK